MSENIYTSPNSNVDQTKNEDVTISQRWEKITRIVAWVFMLLGALFLLGALRIFLSDDFADTELIVKVVVLFIGLFYFLPNLGIILKKKWGLWLTNVIAVISLINIPLGTFYGIVMLIGLRKTRALFK